MIKSLNESSRMGIGLLLFVAGLGKSFAFGGLTLFFQISGIAGNYLDTVLGLGIISLEFGVAYLTLSKRSGWGPANVFLWSVFAGYHIYRMAKGTFLPCPCLGTFWKVTALSPIAPFLIYTILLTTYCITDWFKQKNEISIPKTAVQ